MIPHMVIDNIIAYKRAIEATTTAQVHQDWDELRHCSEDEQLKLDGLLAVINIAIAEAARAEPYSPDAINGDVNQAPEPARQPHVGHADFDTGLMATLRNLKHLAQSKPPKPTHHLGVVMDNPEHFDKLCADYAAKNAANTDMRTPPKPTVLDKLKADPDVAPVFEHLPPPLPEEE